MVARLAARLKKDGSDVRGWVQLVRSYRVLGQADKAQGALADAKAALAGDPDKLRQLAEGTAANAKPDIPMAPAAAPAAPMAPSAGAASPGAPGPTAADVAAAAKLDPGQQNAMIATMVARLADRLKADGSDFDGWQRLIRAYVVLGERDKAQSAASDARKALSGDADKLQRIEDVIKNLGLQG
jgi:cytochrome c-type biogenesis protein CcmH